MTSVPTTRPPKGFTPWEWRSPPFDLQRVEIWREGMMSTMVVDRHVDPQWNVAGVWWRVPVVRPAPLARWVH